MCLGRSKKKKEREGPYTKGASSPIQGEKIKTNSLVT